MPQHGDFFGRAIDEMGVRFSVACGLLEVSVANGIQEPRPGAVYGSPVVELRSSVTPGKMKNILEPLQGWHNAWFQYLHMFFLQCHR